MNRSDAGIRWGGFVVLGVALAAISGRLAFHVVNDSPSYLKYPLGDLPQMLQSIRTPGYPILLWLIDSTVGWTATPFVHVVLHATAAWALCEELLGRSMGRRRAIVAAFCVLIGCTAMDNINTISTDAPAASLGVLTAVFLMRASRRKSPGSVIACGLFSLTAIAFRPAYLFLLPWMTVCGWMLVRHDGGEGWSRFAGFRVSVAVLLVLIGWMALRKSVVNDFGLVPFGHQNLSAILVQTVPQETLRSLTGEGGELSSRVADQLLKDGFQSPEEGRGLPTLTIENQWDLINYNVILPIASELENLETIDGGDSEDAISIRVHRRVADMNHQILAVSKRGYIRWLILAMRRSVWGVAANIMMHPVFLAMTMFATIWLLAKCISGVPMNPVAIPGGWSALAIVAITYAAMKIGFVILTSPPLGRFADAGAIFLPGLVAILLIAGTDESKATGP